MNLSLFKAGRQTRFAARPLALLLCLLAAAAVAVPAAWARDYGETGALREVKTITVRLEGVGSAWHYYGFKQQALEDAIVKRLTDAGIRVVGPAEAQTDPSAMMLAIHVYVEVPLSHYSSFGIFVKLRQKVPVGRGEGYISQPIWSDWQVGSFEYQQYEQLAPHILQLVDHFVHDYRKDKYGY